MAFHGSYISSGKHNGFFTLRMVSSAEGFYKDQFCKTLARSWDKAFAAYELHCQRTGRKQMTHRNDEFDLCEWGSAGTTDWSVARYWNWKVELEENGIMPFGKHRGTKLADLSPLYRNWVRGFAKDKSIEGNKFAKRTWDMVVAAIAQWERADQEAEGAHRHAAIMRVDEIKAADARSVCFGKIGERQHGLEATIEAIKFFDSDFGGSWLIKGRTTAGNVFVWWSSRAQGEEINGSWRDLARGDVVVLDGTVKGFDDYKGTKQTKLSRCKIKEWKIRAAS